MVPMPQFLWSTNPLNDPKIDLVTGMSVPGYLKDIMDNYEEESY